MAQQLDFLRFTDYQKNPFELEEFYFFLSNFDFCEPDFLAWIEHNKAPYVYFDFYVLLVKNFLNQQKNIADILAFLLRQDLRYQDGFIKLIKKPQQKYPNILDLTLFENALIEHLKQQDINTYFANFESLFNACCSWSFDFKSIPIYLNHHVHPTNKLLIDRLLGYGCGHDVDYGILEHLIIFSQQGYTYNIYHNLKYWLEKTQQAAIKEKIALISQLILQNVLKESELYSVHSYIANQTCNKAISIEGYIDLLQHFPSPQTKFFLNQLIENTSLHLTIRFEATLIYFLSYQQQHPLKAQLTKQFLSKRLTKDSPYTGIVNHSDLFKQTDFFSLDEIIFALQNHEWHWQVSIGLYNYKNPLQQQRLIPEILTAILSIFQRILKLNPDSYIIDGQYIRYLASILKIYELSAQQRQQLQDILLNGLKEFVTQLPNQKHLHQETIELINYLEFSIPDEYFDLLGAWTKLSFAWQAKNLDPQTVWQQLIDAQAVTADAEFDAKGDFINQFLAHNNHITHGRRSDEQFNEIIFEHFFDSPVEWLEEYDIENISAENIIHINLVTPDLEWQHIDYFNFKYNEQYYRFFIYDFMGRDWINNSSFLAVFNQILKQFGSNKAVYSLDEMDNYYGGDSVYFSADADKFDRLNQVLAIPCIPSVFFIPVS